jgi:hypothetical protein
MKRLALVVALGLMAVVASGVDVCAQSFSDVAGKWTLTRSAAWGEVTQKLDLKDDRFSYREVDKNGTTLLVARGDVKVERIGPFKALRLTNIEGGYSEGELGPTNDDRVILFTKGWNTLTLALNFDAYRDGEDAKTDVYKKSKE